MTDNDWTPCPKCGNGWLNYTQIGDGYARYFVHWCNNCNHTQAPPPATIRDAVADVQRAAERVRERLTSVERMR